MALRIYTRTGDDGETGLWGGARVAKDDLRVATYGDVDELNAVLGVVLSLELPSNIAAVLTRIQSLLFELGAELATMPGKPTGHRVTDDDVAWLEQSIDAAEVDLAPLRTFVLPGGVKAAADLHVARTVCRRAERALVTLRRECPDVSATALHFLNRLSDLLFVLARATNRAAGCDDVPWVPR